LPTVFLKGFVFKLTSERLISSWNSSFVHLSFNTGHGPTRGSSPGSWISLFCS
jgi:hypothetical protein